ncbi:MAG: hypothetical protein COS92_05575, partial [Desulfobacterales bacterium CG07_land_8_20_14_0_80_52_14]
RKAAFNRAGDAAQRSIWTFYEAIKLEWQHRLFYYRFHLVGLGRVVFEQYLSTCIDEVYQSISQENACQSRILSYKLLDIIKPRAFTPFAFPI